MKISVIALMIISFASSFASSAQKAKTITVNAGSSLNEAVPFNEIYLYPAFQNGSVHFKDGTLVTAKLNYHLFDDEIKFINPKGDTLGIDNEATIRFISTTTDTFYYFREGYVRRVGGNTSLLFAVQQKMKEIGKEQESSYGQTTSAGSTQNTPSLDKNSGMLHRIPANYNRIFTKENRYFIGDRSNNFLAFNKKNLLKMYGKSDSGVSNYLKENEIDFNKEQDLQKLIVFLQTSKNLIKPN
ncbi:hypothetical protein EXU57_03055 [Segetibacter sp. 3557_3]|uniref:hypothetical protein n=1 Tax=Segetibacter sp. 3557_3 TaxID=2547429 RepID=UPI00105871E3|nr:hypothetical protein [Segetibacter sp. 3557_3]TDH29065.1 hypothetical protein EXU57_03055 [Segetibacter sp. 3557_3]